MQELVKNLLAAMGETIQGLEWMSADTKRARGRKAVDVQSENRLSRSLEGLQRGANQPHGVLGRRLAGRAFNVKDDLLDDWKAC